MGTLQTTSDPREDRRFRRLIEAAAGRHERNACAAAARLLAEMPDRALEACEGFRSHHDAAVRARAARVATRIVQAARETAHPGGESFLARGIALLDLLARDPEVDAAIPATRGLAVIGAPSWRGHLDRFLRAADWRMRCEGVTILSRHGEAGDLNRAVMLLNDPAVTVRQAAIQAVVGLAPSRAAMMGPVVRMLSDDAWQVRHCAVRVLGERGELSDVVHIQRMFKDPDEDVRKTALGAAASLDQDRSAEFALALVSDPCAAVAKDALSRLERAQPPVDLVGLAMERIRSARGESGRFFLDLVQERAPERLPEAVARAAISRSAGARGAAAEIMVNELTAGRDPEKHRSILTRMLADSDYRVRLTSLGGLLSVSPPAEAKRIALAALHDPDDEVKIAAIECLRSETDPGIVEDLLPLARDAMCNVRLEAITLLAGFDDERIGSELISSLDDEDEDVRARAGDILRGGRGRVPSIERLVGGSEPSTALVRIQEKVKEIRAWASRIGQELLGLPVVVHAYRQGIGRTCGATRRKTVHIEVTDTPVTSGHPQGEEIMRGIALHEIGHHLCDFGVRGFRVTNGIARSEGLGEIYDILLDERLERIVSARRPEWAACFDRLGSWVFAQEERTLSLDAYASLAVRTPAETRVAVLRGELPGRILPAPEGQEASKAVLKSHDLLAIPGAVPPLLAFLWCLRGGFDPRRHPDPNVAAAIAEIPRNLKRASHAELLMVARRIGDRIGRTEQHKRQMEEFRRALRLLREGFRRWEKALDQLGEAGLLSDWMRGGAPEIREESCARAPRTGISPPGRRLSNLGPNLDFPPLENEKVLVCARESQMALARGVRRHVRRLRPYMERLGRQDIDEHGMRRGRRLDLARARTAALLRSPNLLVHSTEECRPNAYISVLIDRSGSMEGERIERAKAFAALLAESVRDLPGIEGHVNAFDGDTFYRLGDFRRNAIALLTAGGGNNDAGALWRAAEMAIQSRKRNRLLIMVSDGLPAECTFESLKHLVRRLTDKHGIVCAQVAVAGLDAVAFRHYVDLSRTSTDEALTRFGRLLIELTAGWH